MMKRKLFVVLAVILSILLLIFSIYIITRTSGKNKLTKNDKTPTLPRFEEVEDETDKTDTSEYSVKYKEKKYKYNENLINILIIGVDTDKKQEKDFYGKGGQADVLLLACIDPDADEVTMVSIPRDTVSDVVVYDYQGEAVATQKLPISLSHAYGDGGIKSAELTVNAVSELLYGLPIHAWCSLNVDSIKIINDAVGGVPVIADESNIAYLPKSVKIGDEYLLMNVYARRFVVNRFDESDSTRRIRQKQYLSSFIKQAKNAFRENPLIVVDVYKKLNDYLTTSLTFDEIVWLAGEVVGMNIGEDFITLAGEEIQGETMTEFYVDEISLYETMLDIFYTEVE